MCVGGRVRCKYKVTEEPEAKSDKRKKRAKEGGSDLTSKDQEAEEAEEEESEEERRSLPEHPQQVADAGGAPRRHEEYWRVRITVSLGGRLARTHPGAQAAER